MTYALKILSRKRWNALLRWTASTALVMLALGAASRAPAQPADEGAEPTGFEAFRVLVSRNIFDPERRPDLPAPQPREVPTPAPPSEVVEVVLLGTLVHGDRHVAFVREGEDGKSEVIESGRSVAGFEVAEIDTKGVRLTREGADIHLPVGQALVSKPAEQDNARTWEVKPLKSRSRSRSSWSRDGDDSDDRRDSNSEHDSNSDTDSDTDSDSGGDDILKRMMERRQKELQ